VRADSNRKTPFARITGKSVLIILRTTQRKTAANSEETVHRDRSLDSCSQYTLIIWGTLEKVVSRAATYPAKPKP
jgi:hypothetical protein